MPFSKTRLFPMPMPLLHPAKEKGASPEVPLRVRPPHRLIVVPFLARRRRRLPRLARLPAVTPPVVAMPLVVISKRGEVADGLLLPAPRPTLLVAPHRKHVTFTMLVFEVVSRVPQWASADLPPPKCPTRSAKRHSRLGAGPRAHSKRIPQAKVPANAIHPLPVLPSIVSNLLVMVNVLAVPRACFLTSQKIKRRLPRPAQGQGCPIGGCSALWVRFLARGP